MNAVDKKTIKGRLRTALVAFLLGSWSLTPVYASDTEVYARVVEIDSADAAPTLMMMLDSSNFMNYCMNDTTSNPSGTACADATDRRNNHLRRAMKRALFGNPKAGDGDIIKPAPGFLRLGYSRFLPNTASGTGGWIRYPALALDSLAASETGVDGIANTDTNYVAAASGNATCDYSAATCTMVVGGSSLTMDKNVSIGLQFPQIFVPRNATIVSATLSVYNSSNTKGGINYYIDSEQSGNAAPFSAAAPMSGRSWQNGTILRTGFTSVSVLNQMQAIVNRADWCGGNAVALRLRGETTGNGSSTLTGYSGSLSNLARRPTLVVKWELTEASGFLTNTCHRIPLDTVSLVDSVYDDIEWVKGIDQVQARNNTLKAGGVFSEGINQVGVRFDNLKVSQGATVDYAYLYSTLASGDADTGAPDIRVDGIKVANVDKFCDLSTKPFTCKVPDAGRTDDGIHATFNLAYETDPVSGKAVVTGRNFVADVTKIAKEIVDQGAWAEGNTMGFVLQNAKDDLAASSLRGLAAADSGLSKSMVLHIRALTTVTDLKNTRKTVRQDIYEDMEQRMVAEGGTPLGTGYQETARYLLGMQTSETPQTFTMTGMGTKVFNAPDLRAVDTDGKTYITPLDRSGDSCSAAYIFALTDGYAQSLANVDVKSKPIFEKAPTVTGLTKCGQGFTYDAKFTMTGNDRGNLDCMGSVAAYLYNKDLRDPEVVPDYKPIIRTNTVLFNGNPPEQMALGLDGVATAGGGKFYVSRNEDEVLRAILETLRSVIEKTGSITAPGVAVNQFNRLTHLDQLYYAVFDPDQGNARWRGNVKRYRLKFTETDALIVDKNDDPAIDSDTFFSDEAWSFWSPEQDGKNTSLGGVGSRLPTPATRKLLTSFPDYVTPAADSQGLSLTALSTGTAATVTSARGVMSRLTTDDQVKNVINWLLGYNITVASASDANLVNTGPISTTNVGARGAVGGVLHSQPILVNYGYDSSVTANEAAANPDLQKNYLFFSTMEGMLHAVEAKSDSGIEKFAFMPRETLADADLQALNVARDEPLFGLDLTWSVLRVDGDKDLQIAGNGAASDPDKVWLFGGMRMGGRNYYGMNVTDLDDPRLKWVIEGGTTGPFAKLGQTWSKPVLGDVKIGSTVKTVLFFAGGYDPKHEDEGFDATLNASDELGNQLYIVDPDTGEVLFWASGTASGADLESEHLKFSIPSEVKAFDANKDGLVDAVYVGDLGGQVLRLDIQNGAADGKSLGNRVKLLASIGQDVVADTTNHRRFYEPPSVATMLDATSKQTYVIVAMGTGYRSHPLNDSTEDAFYLLRDNDVLRTDLATATDLQDTIKPDVLATVDPASDDPVDMTGKMGWVMFLPQQGEKVMASPILLFGEVFFTSYIPTAALATSKCSPVIGVTRLWRMGAYDAAVVRDINKDGKLTAEDRVQDNLVEGLGGAPQLLVGEDGKNAIIAGTGVERNQDLNSANMRRTRWFEKSKR